MTTIPYNQKPRIEHRKRQSDRYYRRTGFRRPSDRLNLKDLASPLPPPTTAPEPPTRPIRLQFTEQRDPLRIEVTHQDRTGHEVKHVLSGDQVLIAVMVVLIILGAILLFGVQP